MHQHVRTLCLLATAACAGRSAKPEGLDLAASASEIPEIAGLLRRAGWEPTPELSGVFAAGSVFHETAQGHRLITNDCLAAPPVASGYRASEVITSLSAGVSVGLSTTEIGVSGDLVRKVRFSVPVQWTVPLLSLAPTHACRAQLQALPPEVLGAAYVVQEALTAQVIEQTCGTVDARGRFLGIGAETELSRACIQESTEPVAVGFRRVALAGLLGLEGGLDVPIGQRPTLGHPRPEPGGTTVGVVTAYADPYGFEMHLATDFDAAVRKRKRWDEITAVAVWGEQEGQYTFEVRGGARIACGGEIHQIVVPPFEGSRSKPYRSGAPGLARRALAASPCAKR